MRVPGFIGPSYTSQSTNVDCQRTVNLVPEINPLGTGKEREIACLISTPGLRTLVTLPKSSCRGAWTASNGAHFRVNGDRLYSISSSWGAPEIGTLLTDSGPVSIADNGKHMMIVDGSRGYVWRLDTNVFTLITDPVFPAATHVCYLDGYFIFNYPNSGQFGISGLNDVTFDALDIAVAEGSPDNLVGILTTTQNVQLFGTQSIEVYYNSGDPDFPFARIQGALVDTGCLSPFTICKIAGASYWVGADKDGAGIVYRMQGYQPQRISGPFLESIIKSLTAAQLASATAYTYQQGGHSYYVLNLGTNSTWVFDASTEFWHERTFSNKWSEERHRGQWHAVAYGLNVVGDYQNGKVYALDPKYYTDDGTPIARTRIAPHISHAGRRVSHLSFELDIETGVGLDGTGQGIDPKIMLSWSDDGGHAYSNERFLDFGKIGRRKTRPRLRRLGSTCDRVYKVKITDPVPVTIIGANLEIEEGVS